jgi:hypothetical protein
MTLVEKNGKARKLLVGKEKSLLAVLFLIFKLSDNL